MVGLFEHFPPQAAVLLSPAEAKRAVPDVIRITQRRSERSFFIFVPHFPLKLFIFYTTLLAFSMLTIHKIEAEKQCKKPTDSAAKQKSS